MKITTVVVGIYEENCYILEKNGKCLVVDPGDNYPKIKEAIKDLEVLGVLITHDHFDHTGALEDLLKDYKVPVYHKQNLNEGLFQIGEFIFETIMTPGHTSDSVTFYFEQEKLMFTGDFVFRGTVGRCDLPTGDADMMDESILKIKQYPMDVMIYSGHGHTTTLDRECLTNAYF